MVVGMDVGISGWLPWDAASKEGRAASTCAGLAVTALLPVGFHIVALNVPAEVVQSAINASLSSPTDAAAVASRSLLSVLWSCVIASQSVGALIGCLLMVRLERRYGAKQSLLRAASAVLLLGSFFLLLAQWIFPLPLLLLGRILVGIYTGLTSALVPLFVQQVAPKTIRGTLSCFMHISVCCGSALAAILSLDFMLGSPSAWGIMLALPGICAIALLLVDSSVPSTPAYFLEQRKRDEAEMAIRFYYGAADEDDDDPIEFYQSAVEPTRTEISMTEAWSDPKIRRGILLGSCVSAAQVFSGSMATISYSTSMFEAVSFLSVLVPFLPALGSLLSIVLTLPALRLVESSGRRALLLRTLWLCVLANLMFLFFSLLASDGGWASWAFGGAFFLYGVGYNLGIGPLAYFLPAELVSSAAAGVAMGFAVAVNWISTLITTFLFYPLQQGVGGLAYLLFVLPTTVMGLILYRWLPETSPEKHAKDQRSALLLENGHLQQGYGATV